MKRKESKTVEFKESITNTFLKTVSAFANYDGGTILFGMNDEGKAVGVENPKQACLDIENKINDCIFPNPDYVLEINPRTRVVSLMVNRGIHQPYFYNSKAYKRNDTSTIEVDRLELSRLILEGQNLSFESTPARITPNAATFHALGERLRDILGISSVTDDTLKTLELKNANGTLNVAGELLSDDNSFPGIDMVKFGNSINVFLDRETYEHSSLFSQYDSAVALYRKYYQYEEIAGAQRVFKSLVPEPAFREAIANALVHRQWDVPSCIKVAMHPDRIEITSPGGLPQGISEQEYLAGHLSTLRNPILGNVFFRLRVIERFGTGILRIKDAYRDSARKPTFSIAENSITVSLPVMSGNASLSPDEIVVLEAIKGRELPISDIVLETGFGKTKAQKLLKSLEGRGYLSIVGTGRGTKYSA